MSYSKGKSYNEYTKACMHCKTSGYRWGKHKEGWRLFNKDGKLHECFKKDKPNSLTDSSNYTFGVAAQQKQTTLIKGDWKYIHSSNYDSDFFVVKYKNIEVGRILFNDVKYQFYNHPSQLLTELHLILLGKFCECLNEMLEIQ